LRFLILYMILSGVKALTKKEKRKKRLGDPKAGSNEIPKSEIISILSGEDFTMEEKGGRNASHFFFKHPLLLKHFDLLKKHPYWQQHICPGGRIQIIFHGEKAYGSEARKINQILDLLDELKEIEKR